MPTSVPFEEIGASPSGRGSRRGDLVFNREFKVNWAYASTFVTELLFGGLLGLPKQFPGWPGMRVQEVTQEPYIEKPTNNATFYDVETYLVEHEFARIKVAYGPLTPPNANDNLPDGTYAEYEQEEAGEFFEIPGSKMAWYPSLKPTNVPAVTLISMTDHSIQWHRVPTPPWDAISSLKGCVNETAFRIPATGQWVAPETLLFMGSKVKKTFNLFTAAGTWSLSYRFRERSIKAFRSATGAIYTTSSAASAATVIGWNHSYRQETNAWERRVNPLLEKEYQTGAFTSLFAFGVGFT